MKIGLKIFFSILYLLYSSYSLAMPSSRLSIAASEQDSLSVLRVSRNPILHSKYYRWRIRIGKNSFHIRTHEPHFYLKTQSSTIEVKPLGPHPVSELRWEKIAALKAKPEFTLNPFARDDDQIAFEPTDKRPVGTETSSIHSHAAPAPKLEPLHRSHWIRASIRSFSEQFTVSRSEIYTSPNTQGLGTGFSLEYFLQPTLQLVASLDTHASETSYDEAGEDAPASFQKRLSAFFGPRVDTLNLEARRQDMSLYLGPAFGFHQLPVGRDDQLIYDLGLGVSWTWLPTGLSLDAQIFSSSSRIFNANLTSPWGWKQVYPFAGYYMRDLSAKSDSSKSSFSERGLRIGAGLSW